MSLLPLSVDAYRLPLTRSLRLSYASRFFSCVIFVTSPVQTVYRDRDELTQVYQFAVQLEATRNLLRQRSF